MNEELHIGVIIVAVIGSYAVLASGFLLTGQWLRRRFNSERGHFAWGIHLLALFGFLLGCLLAWSSYQTDHPMKERHLMVPVLFVALVYGAILVFWLKANIMAWVVGFLRSLTEKKLEP